MKLLEKILIPTDFGPKVNSILPLVGKLARAFDSTVLPLHVACHLPDCTSSAPVGKEQVQSRMDAFVKDLLQAGAPVVEPILVEGNPPLQIELAANNSEADLIMIALDRKPIESNPWFGTITQKLLRRMETPMWISRSGAVHSLRNILCAVDFSESTCCALKAAITLARFFEGKLTVLHIIPDSASPHVMVSSSWFSVDHWTEGDQNPAPFFASNTGFSNADRTVVETETRLRTAREELEQFVSQFDLRGIHCERLVRCGSAVDQILAVAGEHGNDLLILGSRDSTEIGHLNMAIDSTSESVVEAANVPVLVFRKRDLFIDK